MKTSELIGPALDWAVAKCEGQPYHGPAWTKPSTDWAQGGPILDREKIDIQWEPNGKPVVMGRVWIDMHMYLTYGPTPLIAAMRCYVSSKLGDEVDIPKELT